MNDAATINATARRVEIQGETLLIEPLRVADFGALQDWIDNQFGDPFELANQQIATGKYNTTQQQFLYRLAMEMARQPKPRIGMPDADALLRSASGIKEMIFVALSKTNPGFDRAAADRLYARMSFGDIGRLFELVNLDMVMSPPKAETGGTTHPTT